ncbi:MAG: flagellar basal body-associated protein FliL [Sedimentitalea sp.]
MTDATADASEVPKKASKVPLIMGLVLAIAGGGGGFFAVSSGLLPFGGEKAAPEPAKEEMLEALPDISYVELEPITIAIAGNRDFKHLRFRAHLEVDSVNFEDVSKITPRIIDIMNGYLRAIELSDLTNQMALVRLRGQLLRRIQIVAGEGRVRDLLVMEFVLN